MLGAKVQAHRDDFEKRLKAVLADLKRKPNAILFIDDSRANVDRALAAGMPTMSSSC